MEIEVAGCARIEKVQEKKVKKISDMNINPFKAVGNGGVTSSSGSSTPTPYLANGENADKSYHSLSNDFSFPPRGISVHAVIDKFAERGLRSLAVAYQEVPDGWKESSGSAWQFIGLMPLFDPPRHDSAETITRALNVGVNVKMITDDASARNIIGKMSFGFSMIRLRPKGNGARVLANLKASSRMPVQECLWTTG
ncbi:hypothetical protein TEA_021380 [Camellia sinensis var. sinensis]|uniref:Uncharacterized protein n=1 Tax=Camellia sinensis var. sinensis TaxID=542762 RepID=A0A4S4E9U4_CAMSN|nr:hypothetical protein TEA_021380 [Camellia sinensis var. sinensis]